ncbi:metallophosphoesterase family protein [Pseudophaeobacter sp.]|uniref:metallophosphoesterase family protein n=1 Tax=Pseudophaeobacter sp. TaxID=1971739 RepID=UPI003297C130
MIGAWIAKLRGNSTDFPPLAPATPFYAIGDIHGRADLLIRALEQLPPTGSIICVGDYIDRGENSAEVLRLLHNRHDIQCLKGNHEEMLLKFLDDPANQGPRWLRYGGLQTLASFGVSSVAETSNSDRLLEARDALVTAMGSELINWVRALPLSFSSGNIVVVHAAADPKTAPQDQQQRHLLWGHPEFHKTRRQDGIWIVHGHTIVDDPTAQNGRIAIDTGAYATGKLTIAEIGPDSVSFSTA